MYFLLAPIFILSFYRKIKDLSIAIKEKNTDQIKINLLFLSLILIVSVILVLAIEDVFKIS